jgi:hypothetical protein
MEKTATKQKRSISKTLINIIPGIYELKDMVFFIKGNGIIIKVRKDLVKNKPPLFMKLTSDHSYISSLFPLEDNHFLFDYKNKDGYRRMQYAMTLEPDRVIIKLLK